MVSLMASRRPLLAVVALATLIVQAFADDIWGLPDFTRVHGLSSLVVNNILYLDGGEIFNGSNIANITAWTMGSTVMIGLDAPWSASNITITAIDKPKPFPYAQQPFIWYNPVEDNIQSLRGLIYFYGNHIWRVSSQEELNAQTYIPGGSLWEFSIATKTWTESEIQPPSYIGVLQFGTGIATDTAFYCMGDSIFINPDYTLWAQGGLVEFDFNDRYWFNRSTIGYGPQGTGIFAESVYTPLFGTHGVIIYLGGYTVQDTRALNQGSPQYLQDMSEIFMWDIGRRKVISQRTTGPKPPSRWACVSVGVSEAGSGTFDIFVHGGFTAAGENEVFEPDIANVHVLSIPSFVWTKIPASIATMRGFATAQVIGQSQMVVVGGTDATQATTGFPADPWANGIGVFDLNTWRWTTQYRPDAGPYKRASALVAVADKTPYARFDSPEVAMVFDPDGRSATPGASNMTHSGGSSVNKGAVAGGVVGGVAVLGVIAALAWFFMPRRKSNSNTTTAKTPPYQGEYQDMKKAPINQIEGQELDASGRIYELGHEQGEQFGIGNSAMSARYEMDGSPRPDMNMFGWSSRDSDTVVGFNGSTWNTTR